MELITAFCVKVVSFFFLYVKQLLAIEMFIFGLNTWGGNGTYRSGEVACNFKIAIRRVVTEHLQENSCDNSISSLFLLQRHRHNMNWIPTSLLDSFSLFDVYRRYILTKEILWVSEYECTFLDEEACTKAKFSVEEVNTGVCKVKVELGVSSENIICLLLQSQ